MPMMLRNIRLYAVAAAMAISTPVGAAKINLVDYQNSVFGTQAETGFKIAASFWERMLIDKINIDFNVGYSELPDRVIGGTTGTYRLALVQDITSRLSTTGTSAIDRSAISSINLFDGKDLVKAVSAVTNGYIDPVSKTGVSSSKIFDNDGSINNEVFIAPTPILKALGITDRLLSDEPDATIDFSSAFKFDFDPTDGIASDSVDFIGVAIHEMGHALGFTSGVDLYDVISPDGPFPGMFDDFPINAEPLMSPLDLFRYSAPGVRDWSAGTEAYLSIDGGKSQIFGNSPMSTGFFSGDGNQASHWKDSLGCTNDYGVMDPTFCRGQLGEVKALDLAAFDAIGFNLKFDVLKNSDFKTNSAEIYKAYFAAVPEPMTWVQMIIGFGFIGAFCRRSGRFCRRANIHR